jgi:hypothetical protein
MKLLQTSALALALCFGAASGGSADTSQSMMKMHHTSMMHHHTMMHPHHTMMVHHHHMMMHHKNNMMKNKPTNSGGGM